MASLKQGRSFAITEALEKATRIEGFKTSLYSLFTTLQPSLCHNCAMYVHHAIAARILYMQLQPVSSIVKVLRERRGEDYYKLIWGHWNRHFSVKTNS